MSVSVDPFETMLKSLLRYQSDSGNVSENHMRKKLYENGVTNCLRSNFALLLKVNWFDLDFCFTDSSIWIFLDLQWGYALISPS